MIVEQRIDTFRTGTLAQFLALYEAEGWPVQSTISAGHWATTPRKSGRRKSGR